MNIIKQLAPEVVYTYSQGRQLSFEKTLLHGEHVSNNRRVSHLAWATDQIFAAPVLVLGSFELDA